MDLTLFNSASKRWSKWTKTSLRAKQTLLIMKFTAFLLLVAFLQVGATGTAQKVTISEKNATLQKIFKQIHRQTGYQFFYEDALLDHAGKVSLNVKEASLNEVLNLCFINLPLKYEVVNKTIVVSEKPVVEKIVLQPPPPVTVRGTLKNEKGEPITGVSIVIKGTKKGTVSDASGNFVITEINENATLIFSGVNIETLEISLKGKTELNLTLTTRVSPLDEIQIIAYGQTTKRLKTGSISTVKADIIEKQPVTNPVQALQGRVAGLSITQTGGAIGTAMDIQIRGINTIQSGTQPLIILDGAILPSPERSGTGGYMVWGGTSLNSVNPADIESIEVLKDADATAIYGSRGANGVLIITTKKAKLGNTKFTIDVSTGMNSAINLAPRMNLASYLQLRKEAFAMGNHNPTTGIPINPITPTTANAPDLVTWDQNYTTADWVKYEFGNKAPVYNVQANLSGGDRKLNFYASGGYFKQHDVTRGDPYQERISGNLNINHVSANDRLRITLNSNYLVDKLYPSRGAIQVAGGLIQSLPPNMPLKNPDGTTWWPSGTITQNSFLTNPDAPELATQNSISNSFIGNFDISYRIIKGLSFKTQIGYNHQINTRESTLPSTAINPLNPGTLVPNATTSQAYYQSFNFEPQLTYFGKISKGKIDVLLGSTYFDRRSKTYQLGLDGFTSDLLLNSWAAANNVTSRTSAYNYYRFTSAFGRVNYNWENKYLVNLTYRRDGSSRFGPKKQWGDFGAVGLGWLFTNEKWMKDRIPVLSYGKVRGSYGSTGNDNIPDYRWTNLYTASSIWYNGTSGLASTYLSDSSISWETSKKLDVALELGLFKDRILININWFRTHSTNLLADFPVASSSGFSSFLSNLPAIVENKGWEFEITTSNLNSKSKFQWKTNFNLSLIKNKLLEFPNLQNSSFASRLKIGLPVNNPSYPLQSEWTNIYQGVDTATGLPKYLDLNNDGIINSNDRTYVGSTIPRLFGGLGNTLSYKGFSLDVFFQFSRQLTPNWVFGSTYPGQLSNTVTDWEGNYWKKPGDITKYPRLYSGVSGTNTSLMSSIFNYSSAGLVDLFYVRFKNLSLSYSLPKELLSKAKLSKTVIYVRGQNLITWTSEKIYKDPELIWLRSGMMLKTWTAGIQVTF